MPLVMVLMLTRFSARRKAGKPASKCCRSRSSPVWPSPCLCRHRHRPRPGIPVAARRPGRPGDRHHRGTLQVPDAEDHLGLRRRQGMAGRMAGHHRDEAGRHRRSPDERIPCLAALRTGRRAAGDQPRVPAGGRRAEIGLRCLRQHPRRGRHQRGHRAAVPARRHSRRGGADHLLPARHACRRTQGSGKGVQQRAAERRIRSAVHRADGAHPDQLRRQRRRTGQHADRHGALCRGQRRRYLPAAGAIGRRTGRLLPAPTPSAT